MCTHAYICMQVYEYLYVYTVGSVCVRMRIYEYMYVYTVIDDYMYVYICIHVYINTYRCTHASEYKCLHVFTFKSGKTPLECAYIQPTYNHKHKRTLLLCTYIGAMWGRGARCEICGRAANYEVCTEANGLFVFEYLRH